MTPQPNPSYPNPRRTHRPADEWRAIIAAHGVSGLSISAFCHREGRKHPNPDVYCQRARSDLSGFVPKRSAHALGVSAAMSLAGC